MTPSRRLRNTKLVKGEWVSDSYWVGEPIEETRQGYANRRVQEYQREFAPQHYITFEELLGVFRYAGRQYDDGQMVAA